MQATRAIFLIFSLFVTTAFYRLDYEVGGEAAPMLMATRTAVIALFLGAVALFVTRERMARQREWAIVLCGTASGLGQIAMIVLAPPEATPHYQFGLGVIMSVGALMLVPRFATVAGMFGVILSAYLLTVPWHTTQLVDGVVNTLFNMLIAAAILIGSFERERLARNQAILGEALVASNAKLKASRHEALMARDKALAANEAKNRFLASVSHELRTPMNAILGFSDMIRSEVFGPVENDKYREYIGHIRASGMLLQANIDDLLDLARLEAGKLGWCDEVFPLGEALEKAVATCGETARRADIGIVLEDRTDGAVVEADPTRIAQAVINLVTNAVKFSEAGQTVRVQAWRDTGGDGMIRVVDAGRGMSAENLEQVRKPFAQAHTDSYSKGKGGLGLGLAIVSGIVSTMGGRLHLESREGEGTTATLVVPARRMGRARHVA